MKYQIIFFLLYFTMPSVGAKDCFGIVVPGGGYNFWERVIKGAVEEGKSLNIKVIGRGPKHEKGSALGQSNIIKRLDCNSYAIAPDSTKRKKDLDQLARQGKPVVFIDRRMQKSHFNIPLIATNNTKIGEALAKLIIKKLNSKSKVLCVHQDKHIVSTEKRIRGFVDYLKLNSNVLIREFNAGRSVGEARRGIKKNSHLFKNAEIIMVPNESTAIALISELGSLDINKNALILTVDSHPLIIQSIKKGLIYATIAQRPEQMGRETIKALYNIKNSKKIMKDNFIPFDIILKDNLNN